MVKAVPLAPLPATGMSMQEAVEQWQKDTGLYRDLADKHDTLVGWIEENC